MEAVPTGNGRRPFLSIRPLDLTVSFVSTFVVFSPQSSQSSHTMASSSGSREELLHNAVLFLLDPKVKESSLTSRITFLEGKGLTEPEIQEALKRAAAGETGVKNPSPGGWEGRSYPSARLGRDVAYGTGGPTGPPAFPQRDWRDVFVSRTVLFWSIRA